MANPYFGFVRNVTSDGTNVWVDYEICDGVHTFPLVRAAFPADTVTAATVSNLLQTILNAQPTIPAGVQALTNQLLNGQ